MEMNGVGAIVTGGASGLGAATARMLAGHGARVTLIDRNRELGESLAAELDGLFVEADVTSVAEIGAALDQAESTHGVAQIIVNCAGIGAPMKTVSKGEPFPLDLFRKIIDVNLIGTFNVLSQAAARLSRADPAGEERGVIVNTASVAAFDGQVGQAAYAASKAGLVGLTLPVARDLAQHGIRVMTIAPGLFSTPLLMQLPEDVRDSLGRQAPFPPRLGDPAEFATLVRAIVENPMLNGEVIRLDGAIRMAPR